MFVVRKRAVREAAGPGVKYVPKVSKGDGDGYGEGIGFAGGAIFSGGQATGGQPTSEILQAPKQVRREWNPS